MLETYSLNGIIELHSVNIPPVKENWIYFLNNYKLNRTVKKIWQDIQWKCSLIAELMFRWQSEVVARSVCRTCPLPGARILSPRDLTSNPFLNAGQVSGDIALVHIYYSILFFSSKQNLSTA